MDMPLYRGEHVDKGLGKRILRGLARYNFECIAIVASGNSVDDIELKNIYGYYAGSVVEDTVTNNLSEYKELIECGGM